MQKTKLPRADVHRCQATEAYRLIHLHLVTAPATTVNAHARSPTCGRRGRGRSQSDCSEAWIVCLQLPLSAPPQARPVPLCVSDGGTPTARHRAACRPRRTDPAPRRSAQRPTDWCARSDRRHCSSRPRGHGSESPKAPSHDHPLTASHKHSTHRRERQRPALDGNLEFTIEEVFREQAAVVVEDFGMVGLTSGIYRAWIFNAAWIGRADADSSDSVPPPRQCTKERPSAATCRGAPRRRPAHRLLSSRHSRASGKGSDQFFSNCSKAVRIFSPNAASADASSSAFLRCSDALAVSPSAT